MPESRAVACDVAVVGSYNQDFVWRTDLFPVPGETRLGRFSTGPGGKGFNQAVAVGTMLKKRFGTDLRVLPAGSDVAQEVMHPLLLIEVPRLLFPFARQILVEMTQQGGFPPVVIPPVDFQALYLQKFGKEIEESRQRAAG